MKILITLFALLSGCLVFAAGPQKDTLFLENGAKIVLTIKSLSTVYMGSRPVFHRIKYMGVSGDSSIVFSNQTKEQILVNWFSMNYPGSPFYDTDSFQQIIKIKLIENSFVPVSLRNQLFTKAGNNLIATGALLLSSIGISALTIVSGLPAEVFYFAGGASIAGIITLINAGSKLRRVALVRDPITATLIHKQNGELVWTYK